MASEAPPLNECGTDDDPSRPGPDVLLLLPVPSQPNTGAARIM